MTIVSMNSLNFIYISLPGNRNTVQNGSAEKETYSFYAWQ